MALKSYKPVTPGQRYKTTVTRDSLTTDRPEKGLTTGSKRISGRDSAGRISVRRRGGGHKRRYRAVDFKRDKWDIPGKVASIEYDPNRSAFIALVVYADGEKRYILAPKNLTVGMPVVTSEHAPIRPGNCMPLESMPLGTVIHNIELQKGHGGQLARSAGASAVIVASDKDYVTVKLPSDESRLVFKRCLATVGVVGNEDHMNVTIGKAGRSRWMGRRPKVLGVSMNPVDHPHGGGEGHTNGGRHPVSPTGQPTKGYKTRKKRKTSSRFIVKRRGK
ncbi:MAG: 50S ribosomal protein L2 [Spirochaetaceae bacterium]|nr:MAG: 50S ribosomal protein L2 [Spirochaetaceae bacterium]